MKKTIICWRLTLPFILLAAAFVVRDCGAITLDEIKLMLRSGFSSETIIREDLVGGRFYGTFNAEQEKELKAFGASPALIDALKSGKYAATQEETADFLQRQHAAKQEAANHVREQSKQREIAQQAAQRQPRTETQQAPAQTSFEWQFKLPSEIEADKKAAKAAEIAARKAYCETHPAECETQEAAQQARMKAEETQRELDSLKTTLWMEGLRP